MSDLTRSQTLIWAGQQLDPTSTQYNTIIVHRISGKLDPKQFNKAYSALIDASDILRTTVEVNRGIPNTSIAPPVSRFDLIYVDETGRTSEDYLELAKGFLFDISKCMVRSWLIKEDLGRYIWIFTAHHLITDVWGMSVLSNLLSDLYQGKEIEVPEFRPRLLESRYTNDQKEYWATLSERLTEPGYFFEERIIATGPRAPRISSPLGTIRSKRLFELATSDKFRSFNADLSVFNLIATIYSAYLWRIGEDDTVCFGTPSHNRITPEDKITPGLFIEFFPLAVEVNKSDTLESLYTKASTESLQFLRNASPGLSTPELARKYRAVLNFISAKFDSIAEFDTVTEWIHPGLNDPGHHIRLHVSDLQGSGNLLFEWDINTDAIGDEIARDIPDQFIRLMDAMLEDPSRSIDSISLGEFKSAPIARLHDFTSLSDVLREKASTHSDKQAIIDGMASMTYGQYDEAVDQAATKLIQNGVNPGDRVCIVSTRSAELMVAILAVLRSGASFVPVPVKYPAHRIDQIIEDSGPTMIITDGDVDLSHRAESVMSLSELTSKPQVETSSFTPVSQTDLAYILYTSGSTGQPKGVMITHGSLSNYVNWAADYYCNGEAMDTALCTSIGFDLTITSMFLPLMTGAAVRIYPEGAVSPDLAILRAVEDGKAHLIKCTPSHLKLIEPGELNNTELKVFIVGGEDFPSKLASEIDRASNSRIDIYNEYGPTEATVGCIVHKYDRAISIGESVPIGNSAAGAIIHIVDEYNNPVPNGITGEILIGGPVLSAGYLNLEEETRKAFCSLEGIDGTFYRTGDFARVNKNGDLDFKGRRDKQIKINGVRVEINEIEQALNKHPEVQDTFVDYYPIMPEAYADHVSYCSNCGLPSNYPNSNFDEEGVCSLCRSFEGYQQKVEGYFKAPDDLKRIFDTARERKAGQYDCLMLYSGGKDSTYALGQLVDMGLSVLAFTLDNGYISDQAKANVRRVVNALNVDHVFGATDHMDEIFVDSLKRYNNVCNGCFKTIYTLSTKIAIDKGIPIIVTGLSRGQFFETRLTEELFWSDSLDANNIDSTILDARKAYHKVPDAVNQLLDVQHFEDESVFDRVQYVDFYRYTDVSLDEMYDYLDNQLPWVRPTDTGRSTNCLINQVGIYVHTKEVGYNNYAFPYSWDVRIGHKNRDAALEEINEVVDEEQVSKIMHEIGFDASALNKEPVLTAYYTSDTPVPQFELNELVSKQLPSGIAPRYYIHLPKIPLTPNGKVDRSALRKTSRPEVISDQPTTSPSTDMEEFIHAIFTEVMNRPEVDVLSGFIEIGGNSLAAIRIAARLQEQLQFEIPVTVVFEYDSIARLSTYLEARIEELLGDT